MVLISYSLGADVLPFMAVRLPDYIRHRINPITLPAPGRKTAFGFDLNERIGGSKQTDQFPMQPEVD